MTQRTAKDTKEVEQTQNKHKKEHFAEEQAAQASSKELS